MVLENMGMDGGWEEEKEKVLVTIFVIWCFFVSCDR